ncbi:MAG: ABC transporter permease [Oscillospiraceae bacterium]|nr:ABC transporter permease [Oscillospiraceae bacterium]
MGKYIVKRLILLLPSLLLVCTIVFGLMRLIPGSAVDAIVQQMVNAGQSVDRGQVERMLGLDKPAVEQFLIWLGGALRGDLGSSLFDYQPVLKTISTQLPVTLELGIMTLLLSNVISIPLGLFCASRQNSLGDYVIRAIGVVLMAVPVFWIATIALVYPATKWGYAPPMNYVSFFVDPLENLRMFLLPALLGAMTSAGNQLRMVRTMNLEVLRMDYVRTAWAKGAHERLILFRHVFRNAMIPVVTAIGGAAGGMAGGSVILENLFNIPGIGQQMVTALNNRDYPVIQGCVVVFSVIVMLINLLVDISYKWIDPRVELD